MSRDSSAVASGGHGLEIGILQERPLAALDLEQMLEIARVQEQLLLGDRSLARGARHRRPTASRSTTASRSSGLNGLRTSAVGAGAFRAPRLLLVGARQEDDRDLLRPRLAFSRVHNSAPLMPGMRRSSTITSGRRF